MATARDVPLLVESENSGSERRISPSWTIALLKQKLEPITGVPTSSQKLVLYPPNSTTGVPVSSPDEENATLSQFTLLPYGRLVVEDTRPPGARPNYTDISGVDKYEMPEEEYSQLNDSVLAWKKRNQLGRFDPNKPAEAVAPTHAVDTEIYKKGARCRVGGSEGDRRGEIAYVGEVADIPAGGIWVGVRLDEPTGKNDGTVGGTRYFEAKGNRGVFARGDRVEVGDYTVKDLEDDFMDEI